MDRVTLPPRHIHDNHAISQCLEHAGDCNHYQHIVLWKLALHRKLWILYHSIFFFIMESYNSGITTLLSVVLVHTFLATNPTGILCGWVYWKAWHNTNVRPPRLVHFEISIGYKHVRAGNRKIRRIHSTASSCAMLALAAFELCTLSRDLYNRNSKQCNSTYSSISSTV